MLKKYVADRKTWWRGRLLQFLIFIPILFSIYVIIASVLPFEPYVFHDYDIVPPTICANQDVRVFVDREVLDTYRVDKVTVSGYWLNLDTSVEVGDVSAVVDPQQGMRTDHLLSGAFRSAPGIPGRWRPQANITVEGSVWGWPRTQTIIVGDEELLTVLPYDEKVCRGNPIEAGGGDGT